MDVDDKDQDYILRGQDFRNFVFLHLRNPLSSVLFLLLLLLHKSDLQNLMFGQCGEYVGNVVPVHLDMVQVAPIPQPGFLVLGGAGRQ